jgi:hypothetical protein
MVTLLVDAKTLVAIIDYYKGTCSPGASIE